MAAPGTPPIPSAMYVTTGLHGGGAERLLTNIVVSRRAAGHRVTVVSLLRGGIFRPTLAAAGIPIIDLGVASVPDALRATSALAAVIRDERPSVVYGWMYHANLLAWCARLLAGRPRPQLFWSVFCTDSVGPRFDPWSRSVRRISALLSPLVDGVIYNAVEARAYHRTIGFRERRSRVLPNLIDAAAFTDDRTGRAAVRAELGIPPAAVVVAVVARVNPMKDWGTVQQAVGDLPGVLTVAIGEGTEALPPCSGFIGLGWRDDVMRILSAADIFLLGSAFGEGTSLALGEAMLCGLPCVVTNVGGNASLAGDGAIVVPPGDAAAIRDALRRLASDPELRRACGRRARARGLDAIEPAAWFGDRQLFDAGGEA